MSSKPWRRSGSRSKCRTSTIPRKTRRGRQLSSRANRRAARGGARTTTGADRRRWWAGRPNTREWPTTATAKRPKRRSAAVRPLPDAGHPNRRVGERPTADRGPAVQAVRRRVGEIRRRDGHRRTASGPPASRRTQPLTMFRLLETFARRITAVNGPLMSTVARSASIWTGRRPQDVGGQFWASSDKCPVWMGVRGAAVQAESPAKRGRGEATRLDGGEHTPKLSVGRCPGHHNILGSVPARIDRFHAFGNT